MKTMCPRGYHHNGFVATHALGHFDALKSIKYPKNTNLQKKH